MRAIAERIAALLVGTIVVATGVLASLVFLCYAVFAYFATMLSPPLAALATASFVLLAALAGALALNGWGRRPGLNHRQAADEAVGALLAAQFGSLAAKNPRASLLMSLAAGFLAGARSRRSA